MSKLYKLPELPLIHFSERNDLVEKLLEIIHVHQLNEKILKNDIESLKNALADLQHRPKKPRVKPTPLEDCSPKAKKSKKKSKAKKKRVPIHNEVVIKPTDIPKGAVFKGYRTYLVQDMEIKPCNTLFKVERWKTQDGSYLKGTLPVEYQRSHFGPKIKAFVLYQYYQGRVTQPRLLKQLKSFGIEISAGELNHILCEKVEAMEDEDRGIVKEALKNSSYVQTDDTGARHKGKNCSSIHIGNHLFTHFTTCSGKSRLQFLKILNIRKVYTFNKASMKYLRSQGSLKQIGLVEKIKGQELDETELADFLNKNTKIASEKAIREAGILGTLFVDLGEDYTVLSDGAFQYKILNHAGCWIHAIRLLEKDKPLKNEKVDSVINKLCFLYHHLKRYKRKPTVVFKSRLDRYFDQICDLTVGSKSFEEALLRFKQNKKDLLRVLEKTEIPLHNNSSENDLREYVTKRKISSTTRSDLGKRARDVFLSLMKTCDKMRVSFWDFLLDRMSFKRNIPLLAQIIKEKSLVTST
jgi:hypothetical protein